MAILDDIRAANKPILQEHEKTLKEAEQAIERFRANGIDTTALTLKLNAAKRRLNQAKNI